MSDLEYSGKIKGMKTFKQFIAEKSVTPASQLQADKDEAAKRAEIFTRSALDEENHRRTRVTTEPDKTVAHYTREPFEEW